MRKKRIFVSLPISGQEDTFFERIEEAEAYCKKYYPEYDVITPKDINNVTSEILEDHTEREKTAFYMGRDIEELINSDAILSCEGWEKSKGCQVERKCAEVYGLEILDKKGEA